MALEADILKRTDKDAVAQTDLLGIRITIQIGKSAEKTATARADRDAAEHC